MAHYFEDLYLKHKKDLGLELVVGEQGIKREIKVPEAHRPGLSLSGYLKSHAKKRILILGKVEMEYLRNLESEVRIKRLDAILTNFTPAVIVARNYRPSKELMHICETKNIPLLRSRLTTMNLLTKLTILLAEEFAESVSYHGTLVEVFGVGVLIKGDSSVGKSATALGLIERGHRLISDDVVNIKKNEGSHLIGYGTDLTRHHMEIRGLGIINIANLYGIVCVRNNKSIDLVVELKAWDNNHFYDRIGLDEKHCNILGVQIPYHVLPVKPGRNVVLFLETIALNHRLKGMGYNSAKEFNSKLTAILSVKQRTRSITCQN